MQSKINRKCYLLTIAEDANRNYAVCEEQYGSDVSHYSDFEVFELNKDNSADAIVIIKTMWRDDELSVVSISTLPEFAGVGIEIAIMEALAARYEQHCQAPGITTDDEDEIWSLYRDRGPDDPQIGYLTLLPFLPTHYVGPDIP